VVFIDHEQANGSLCFVLVRQSKEIYWGRGEGGKELFLKRGFLESKKSLKEIIFQKKNLKKNTKNSQRHRYAHFVSVPPQERLMLFCSYL